MIYDDGGTKKEVPHCYIDDAHKTLGVMLTLDDNN